MKTVLIIEDNENNLYMMRFIVDKLGHRGPGGAGRRRRRGMAKEKSPRPDPDGHPAARPGRLRRHPAHPRGRLAQRHSHHRRNVLCHGRGQGKGDLAAGCTAYVEKPINPPGFIKILEQYIQAEGEPQ